MPRRDMIPALKNRSGRRNVTVTGTRGRTFQGIAMTRTDGTTIDVKIRSGQYKPLLDEAAKASTTPPANGTWEYRYN